MCVVAGVVTLVVLASLYQFRLPKLSRAYVKNYIFTSWGYLVLVYMVYDTSYY